MDLTIGTKVKAEKIGGSLKNHPNVKDGDQFVGTIVEPLEVGGRLAIDRGGGRGLGTSTIKNIYVVVETNNSKYKVELDNGS